MLLGQIPVTVLLEYLTMLNVSVLQRGKERINTTCHSLGMQYKSLGDWSNDCPVNSDF